MSALRAAVRLRSAAPRARLGHTRCASLVDDSPMPDRRSRCPSPARLVATFATLSVLAACGPITSTAAINDARYAIERAASVQAADVAQYEFTSAEVYLDKAREEWATSDFQHARSFAERALVFAEAAFERAVSTPGVVAPEAADAPR